MNDINRVNQSYSLFLCQRKELQRDACYAQNLNFNRMNLLNKVLSSRWKKKFSNYLVVFSYAFLKSDLHIRFVYSTVIFSLYSLIETNFIIKFSLMQSILPLIAVFIWWTVESIYISHRSFHFNVRHMNRMA